MFEIGHSSVAQCGMEMSISAHFRTFSLHLAFMNSSFLGSDPLPGTSVRSEQCATVWLKHYKNPCFVLFLVLCKYLV